MSKSRNNAIYLKDDAGTVAKKVKRMFGGPPRGANEAGVAAENPIMLYLEAFDPDREGFAGLKEQYERSGIGNAELKERLTAVLNGLLEPIRDRRQRYAANMRAVREALEHGSCRARETARETMAMVHDALDMNYLERY